MSVKKTSFLDELDSIDEVEVKADKAEKYPAPAKNKKERIGFPLLKPNGKMAVQKVDFFKGEINGKFTSFICPKDEDLIEAATKKIGPMLTRYVTIICKYPTKKDGKVTLSGDYELLSLS